MSDHSKASSWQGWRSSDCHGVLASLSAMNQTTPMMKAQRTTIENELQLDKSHIYKFRVDLLMSDPHANMLHLDKIALQ